MKNGAMLRLAPLAAVPLVLVPALGAVQGGFAPDAWVWSATLAAWAAALGLVLGGTGRLRREGPWVVATAALVLWTLASALWSAVPAQSLLEARRALLYGAVVLALVVLARRHAAPVLLAATHIAVSGLVVYALVRYLAGPRPIQEFEGRYLSEPLGYANAVGILAAMAVILSVGRAASATSAVMRIASGSVVPLLALALDLTGSNASWLALTLGLATMALLQPSRRSLARTAAALAPAAIAAAAVGHYSELTSSSSARLTAAPVAAVAALCVIAAAVMLTFLTSRGSQPVPPESDRWRRRLVFATVLAVAGAGALVVFFGGATEPRSSYYHVAWHEYVSHPLLGSGAGTFGHYWLQSGRVTQWGGALDAHSLYLETLGELGPIGLCLVLGVFLYPLRHVIARRGLPAVPTAAGAAVAFLVHAGLDWDWELPAVVVAGLACCAVVAFAEPESGVEASRATRALALAAALVAGAASIAGARSSTIPSAAPSTNEAPQSGALFQHDSFPRNRYLPS
ncbi:MAG: O-antigen ligase family protein [Gaiellaceae bacterium]